MRASVCPVAMCLRVHVCVCGMYAYIYIWMIECDNVFFYFSTHIQAKALSSLFHPNLFIKTHEHFYDPLYKAFYFGRFV